MIKAILFDFNGVLLQDREWHEEALNELSRFLNNRELTKDEIENHVHGTTPQDSLAYILGHTPNDEELKEYLDRKESLYQQIALNQKEEFKLTQGSVDLFEMLRENGIKMTIATSSPLVLVDFYYKYLDLEKWFPFKDIVFNDGTFPGKPAPDIYLKAADKLNVDIKDCLVVEDAKSGVESARRAGVSKVIFLINEGNRKTIEEVKVDKIINSFKDITIEDL
jgi:beta-phosphoglucomutase